MRTVTKMMVLTLTILSITTVALAGSWNIELVDGGGSVGVSSSLVFDSNEDPHISYVDADENLKYAYKNGSSWNISTVDTNGEFDSTSIVVTSNDKPRISYRHWTGVDELKFARNDSGTWYTSIVDTNGSVGMHSSMAIDSSDHEHISYYDTGGHLRHAEWTGTYWGITEVNIAYDTGNYSSIGLDSNGIPHISCYSEDGTTGRLIEAYKPSNWAVHWIESGGIDLGNYTSIAIDSQDNHHISYADGTNDTLKYAFYDGSGWTTSIIENTGNYPCFTSIAVDSNDNPHIAYTTLCGLNYAYWNGSSWDITTVSSGTNNGWDPSLALDANDNPHISFCDLSDGLKYAWYDPTGIEDGDTPTTPTGFALHSAVPNPSDGSASIGFALPYACEVDLSLYDIKGRKIAALVDGTHQPGEFSTDVKGLSSGVYIYELKADEFSDMKKMVVR